MTSNAIDKTTGCADVPSVKSMTIISALDRLQQEAHMSKLSDEFFGKCSGELSFLAERLELTPIQAVVIAIMCEAGEGMTWRHLAKYIGVSRLSLMDYTQEIEALVSRRWLLSCGVRDNKGLSDGFRLPYGIIRAFRHDETFVPENIEGLTTEMFVNRLVRYMESEGSDNSISISENHRFMLQLCELNLQLPFCQILQDLTLNSSKIALIVLLRDYVKFPYSGGNPGVSLNEFEAWMDEGWELDSLCREMKSGHHELFRMGLINFSFASGLVDKTHVKFTEDAISRLLGDYTPPVEESENRCRNILESSKVRAKELMYNPSEEKAVERLRSLLDVGKLDDVADRLKECGMRTGISCLFYGSPGTGKTETVLQLARLTGRAVMQVDIAGMRDKYVGESEKNIKNVFNSYRQLCKASEVKPILLFNEADALIHSRFEKPSSSVERMDNAMQNIILRELEDLDGIMIATTNLTGVLDKAFERRFLFKIEFKKPEAAVRARIWSAMVPHLSESDCRKLAHSTELSGGEIENVARKCKIDYILSGYQPDINRILEFIREERLGNSAGAYVGFR